MTLWRLVDIDDMPPSHDQNYTFERDGRRLTVQWWRSIDKMFYRPAEHQQIIKAPPAMIAAVHAAWAYVELMESIEGFEPVDLAID